MLAILIILTVYIYGWAKVISHVETSDVAFSCYKGCQFAAQLIHNITFNSSVRVELYNKCLDLCGASNS